MEWLKLLARPARQRLALWRQMLTLPVGVATVAASLLAIWDTIDAQLFSESWQERTPTAHDVLELWPWHLWAVAGLLLLVLIILEAAYRVNPASQHSAAEQITDEDIVNSLSKEPTRFIIDNYRPLLTMRLSAIDLPTNVMSEMMGFDLIDTKAKGQGSWSSGKQKPDAFYVHPTPLGSRVFALIIERTQSEPEAIWSGLSDGAQKKIVGWENNIIGGDIHPRNFGGELFNELQAAGIIETRPYGERGQRVEFTQLGSQVVQWGKERL